MPNMNNLPTWEEIERSRQMPRGDMPRQHYAPPFGQGVPYSSPRPSPRQLEEQQLQEALERWNKNGPNASAWDPAFKNYSLVPPTDGSGNWTAKRDAMIEEEKRKSNPLIDKWDPNDPVQKKMMDRKGFGVYDNYSDIWTKENIMDAYSRMKNFINGGR